DVQNPREIASYIGEDDNMHSDAEFNHKAFLLAPHKNLLVIPVQSYAWETRTSYNGALVFHVNESSIELRGLVDHQLQGSVMERSLYIEELLYTKSTGLLRINHIDDLMSVGNITLPAPSKGIEVY